MCLAGHGDAVRWLLSLQAVLRSAAANNHQKDDDQKARIGEPLCIALSALLSHPSHAVQAEAARALAAAVEAVPLLGVSLLPVIMYHLQAATLSDKSHLLEPGTDLFDSNPLTFVKEMLN